MPPVISSRSLLYALDLAVVNAEPKQKTEPTAPEKAPTSSKLEESQEWNKDISLKEQKHIYRVAGNYAMQSKLAKKLEKQLGEHSYLTKKEFNAVNDFRLRVSNRLNGNLRKGDTSQRTLKAEETINRGLQKLAEQGCRSYQMTFRGVDHNTIKALHKAGTGIQENQTFTDLGIPFFSPHKRTALHYIRDPFTEAPAPGMLMHVMGNSGAYSLNALYPDIVFYQSKTPFDVALTGFDQKDKVYKSLLVQQNHGKEHGRLQTGDLLMPSSSKGHVQRLYKVAFILDSHENAPSGKNRLQANLAMAIHHMSPYSLAELIKDSINENQRNPKQLFQKSVSALGGLIRSYAKNNLLPYSSLAKSLNSNINKYINNNELRQLNQFFPLAYEKPQDETAIRDMLAQELQGVLPEHLEKEFLQDISRLTSSPDQLVVSLNADNISRICDKLSRNNQIAPAIKKQLSLLQAQCKTMSLNQAVGYKFFDASFDKYFPAASSDKYFVASRSSLDMKKARDRVKAEMKKSAAVPIGRYLETQVDRLISKANEEGTLKGGVQERTALLEKIALLVKPLTPQELTEKIWSYLTPDKVDVLNAALEKELVNERHALLQRQLDRLPPNAETEQLRQRFVAPSAYDNLEKTKAHLLDLKEEIDQLPPPSPIQKRTVPGKLKNAEEATPSPFLKRSPSTLAREYPDLSKRRMARHRAIDENKSTGKIYADAAKIGIERERIDRMLAKELPLAFPDKAVYREFLQELHVLLKQAELEDSTVGLMGTSTTFYSQNPNKPINWHFGTPQSKKKSDLDLSITGPSFLKLMEKKKAKSYSAEEKGPEEGQVMRERIYPILEAQKHIPKFLEFKKTWEKKLGCEVTIVGLDENRYRRDFILSEPFEEQGHYRLDLKNAIKIMRNLDGDLKSAFKAEIGSRPSVKDMFNSSSLRSLQSSEAWARKMQRLFNQICPEHRLGSAVSDSEFDIYQIQHKGVNRTFLLKVENGEIVDAKPLQPEDAQEVDVYKT